MTIREEEFLKPLFCALADRGIVYAVLRGAETLPYSLGGGDIDLQVRHDQVTSALELLQEIAQKCGGRMMAQMRAPHFVQTELLGCKDGVWWGCCIDIFDGVYVKSVLQIAGDDLLDLRVDNGHGVWTLPHEIGHYLGFVKELMVAGKRSERYEAGAKLALQAEQDTFVHSTQCRRVVRDALENGQVSTKHFLRRWLLSTAIRCPVDFWKNRVGFTLSRLFRYCRPCGKMIAVLGTDGAGKSTLLNEVLPLINLMTHKATIVHHLKPDLLPPLGRLRGVKYDQGHVCTNPHGSKPSGFVGSCIRLAYLSADYLLGYWLKVRVKLAKTPIGYWISDRYAYDLLIDPRRFRVRAPQWIIKLFLLFVPRPDLVICLGGDPEKIYARKPETSIEEVKRQVSILKNFVNQNPRAVWIDTTKSIDESAQELLMALLKRL